MRIYVFFLSWALTFVVVAQQDSVLLDEITVSGNHFQRFSAGGNFQQITLQPGDFSLEEALNDKSSIYFKSYGNQQLATISFRGTSASQTNVLWHGIPANYPTLGQMDFSQWPVWFMESLDLQSGGDGALYGSGAIGGTVMIDSNPSARENPVAQVKMGIGSFGRNFIGVKSAYKSGNLTGDTRLFRSYIENDFDYTLNGEEFTQENASVLNFGLQQKLNLEISQYSHLFADAQLTLNDRDIQPSKLSPDQNDHLETENIRVAAGYEFNGKSSNFSSTLAFLRNDQIYNETDQTFSNQYSALITYWLEVNDKLALRVGSNVNLSTAKAENYTENFTDFRSDIFGSIEYQFLPWWKSTLNLRQSFYQDHFPFTPSLGTQLSIYQDDDDHMVANHKLSVAFRFPTLNDRYWQPGGNPDLKPETGFTHEGGFTWKRKKGNWGNTFSFTTYQTWYEDWIIWLPTTAGFWAPQNFRSVNIYGFEAGNTFKISILGNPLKIAGGYAFTRSLNGAGTNSGNQLPYSPLHNANFQVQKNFQKKISATVRGQLTGKRYTTLDNTEIQSVASFFLVDLRIDKEFHMGKLTLIADGSIKNLFDQDYENLINRAMPGRNYQLNLLIKYK